MNCREFDCIVDGLARREALEPAVRAAAFDHAAACTGCGARLEAQRELSAALAALAEETRSSRAPDGVEFALRQAFREQRAARRRWPLWAAGAAAAALLAVWLVPRAPAPAPAPPAKAVAQVQAPPAPAPAPAAMVAVSQPRTPAPGRRPRIARTRREAPRETGFLALPYARDAAPATEVWITRMRVSRAALAAAGLPVNMDRINEAVVADVAFADDGTARAVRILY